VPVLYDTHLRCYERASKRAPRDHAHVRIMPFLRSSAAQSLYIEPTGKTVTLGSIESQSKFPFRWFTREGRLERPLVNQSSILGRLGQLSERLTKFHSIAIEQAAYLILCGDAIQPHSISGRIENTNYAPAGVHSYNYSTITLTVASWMSPEQVRQVSPPSHSQKHLSLKIRQEHRGVPLRRGESYFPSAK
jgi:hypothetical protein